MRLTSEKGDTVTRHIFIDSSNIYGGAQRAARTLEPHVPWSAMRIYFRNLFTLLERGGEVTTRVLAGSLPPGNEALWDHARTYGYDTDLLRRIERDDGRLVEQGVDEMLHLKIANALLDFPSPQTLVIASGDGRISNFNTSFVDQVKRALRLNWEVEVWSWKEQMTGAYRTIAADTNQISIHRLDPYYRSITFIKAGTYVVADAPMVVGERVVSALI